MVRVMVGLRSRRQGGAAHLQHLAQLHTTAATSPAMEATATAIKPNSMDKATRAAAAWAGSVRGTGVSRGVSCAATRGAALLGLPMPEACPWPGVAAAGAVTPWLHGALSSEKKAESE